MPGMTGILLVVVGVVHCASSLWLRRPALAEMAREGLIGTVGLAPAGRAALFWSVWAGLSWVLLGGLCLWVERRLGVEIPAGFAVAILGYAVLGAALMPKGGFWLVIAGMLGVLLL